ncbi:MAG: cadmium-translocating P-type ATPase [Chloroflexi bacterium]|nr:cadmium-translocating P-type ATPase [Chloroflexota bacterium]
MTWNTCELRIEGMDCADCALHVQEQISSLPGVDQAKVLLAAEKGIVTFDPNLTSLDDIKAAVAAIGYRARAMDEAQPAAAPTSARLFSIIRLAFVGVIGLLALLEIVAERLGLLEPVVDLVPAPVALAAVLIGGYPIFKSALLGLRARSINVDLLMAIGIVAAASIGEYVSAALLVLFILIAHFLESFTTDKARAAIRELVALTPKQARVLRQGREIEIRAEALNPGDIVIVRPGENIPADGQVIDGHSSVNQAPITGESIPAEKGPGDEVFAATLNELGSLRVKVTRVGANTTLGKIIRLVEEAEGAKAPVQRFADRFTAYFLPVVITAAVLTYLISGNIVFTIAVLVVACPCAVALATPLAVVASVGSAARRGLLIKGGLYLEALARVDTVLMDKTGTLTLGKPQVTDVVATTDDRTAADLLRLAGGLERYSEHPLAGAILSETERRRISLPQPQEFVVVPGQGVTAHLEGQAILLGNRKLMAAHGVSLPSTLEERAIALEHEGKTVVFLAQGDVVLGLLAVADVIRPEVPAAIAALKGLGIRHLLLLTGDNERTAAAVAAQLGVDYQADLLPQEKIAVVQQLQAAGRKVAMIGDGINDAPALTQADVGIAMGVAGTDVALEAADVALMRDDWSQIPEAILVGRRAFRTIKQNISFGVVFNIVGISLAAVGILAPVMAAAAESLPDVAVFLNSSRLLRAPKHRQ